MSTTNGRVNTLVVYFTLILIVTYCYCNKFFQTPVDGSVTVLIVYTTHPVISIPVARQRFNGCIPYYLHFVTLYKGAILSRAIKVLSTLCLHRGDDVEVVGSPILRREIV
ncbi:hypothetical protein SFRURICE_002420 [Spodoptera frugiperda]|nr:hypothetical protein SFRURICE_002420 [Spodoptera frugiperda]